MVWGSLITFDVARNQQLISPVYMSRRPRERARIMSRSDWVIKSADREMKSDSLSQIKDIFPKITLSGQLIHFTPKALDTMEINEQLPKTKTHSILQQLPLENVNQNRIGLFCE